MAGNGQEGIEVIKRECPDILFTDIRMPGMDGLSMIAALKSEYPDMQITILTGFRDFEYAREAIRLGVTRFLLKPSKMDELEEAIGVMTDHLFQKEKKKEDAEKSDETEEGPEEIAEKVGFLDIAHFSRVFKKQTGVSANEWRNRMK